MNSHDSSRATPTADPTTTARAPLQVSCESEVTQLGRQVIASLSTSFVRPAVEATVGGRGAAVHLVSGHQGWPSRVLSALTERRGLRAVVVLDPAACPAERVLEVAGAAARAGVVIRLSETFAGNPALVAPGPSGRPPFDDSGGVYVSGVSHDDGAEDLLLTQLRVLRGLGMTPLVPRSAAHRGKGLTYTGTWGEALLVGLATTAPALPGSVRVVGVGGDSTTEVDLPCATTSRPGHFRVSNAQGAWTAPTHYETAHRATFRNLHADLQARETAALLRDAELELQLLADDLRTVDLFLSSASAAEQTARTDLIEVAGSD